VDCKNHIYHRKFDAYRKSKMNKNALFLMSPAS